MGAHLDGCQQVLADSFLVKGVECQEGRIGLARKDEVLANLSRTALLAWLKTAARVVAADGVTINGVLPGRIETPRIVFLDRDTAERTGRTEAAIRADHIARIPAGRYGRPDELAALVAYLCSEPAGYQTATFTAVDGGLLEWL